MAHRIQMLETDIAGTLLMLEAEQPYYMQYLEGMDFEGCLLIEEGQPPYNYSQIAGLSSGWTLKSFVLSKMAAARIYMTTWMVLIEQTGSYGQQA